MRTEFHTPRCVKDHTSRLVGKLLIRLRVDVSFEVLRHNHFYHSFTLILNYCKSKYPREADTLFPPSTSYKPQ